MDWTEVAVCIVQVRRGAPPRGCAMDSQGSQESCTAASAVLLRPPARTLVLMCMQDGIGNANESVLAASTVHGFFSPVVLQTSVLGAPTTLHLFEYTARCVAACACQLVAMQWLPAATCALAGAAQGKCTGLTHLHALLCPAGSKSTQDWTTTRRCRSCSPPRARTRASWTRTAGTSMPSATCCSQSSVSSLMRVGARGESV